ncbi:MAG: hypothetical protein NC039_07320 [Muribaculaceae bacterium]|nr:hypothetical protein [Muribaculaceae bacterium]
MSKIILDNISDALSLLTKSAKSLVKMAVQSRKPSVTCSDRGDRRLIIMGNGPSLAQNISEDMATLKSEDTLAVNFAANAPEFTEIAPRYYLLCDPHFFTSAGSDPNVRKLYDRMQTLVDWPMTLFIPNGVKFELTNPNIKIERFNPVGVEGFRWVERMAYGSGLGMPRPRNVLIPAIMTGILAGYRKIVILGADHSWTRTLSVSDDNEVQSIQPHFYKDNDSEKARVTSVYRDVRLHDIMLSFHLAFKSYHAIERYAKSKGVEIINATPGSFIDAFIRGKL